MIQLMGSAQDGEALQLAIDNLSNEMGKVYVWQETNTPKEIRIDPVSGLDPEFDRAGLRALKPLSELREGHVA
ncbi:hypothetical protein PXK56_18010 [Phaeobacter gallaeciensis]|nr:hypothetical protein [Phaeobacter gallaeciensis]